MVYRLWIGDMDGGAAEDQYAFDWLHAMRNRGYSDICIEPAPDAANTFR